MSMQICVRPSFLYALRAALHEALKNGALECWYSTLQPIHLRVAFLLVKIEGRRTHAIKLEKS
jgi:hypothetical protein